MAGFFIHIDIIQYGAGLLGHSLPGDQVRMVFCNGNKDVVPLLQVGFSVGTGYQVQGFRRISGINNFLCTFGVNKFPHHFLGRIIGFGSGNGKDMGTPVGVAVIMGHIVQYRIDHRQRALGGSGIIKINDLMAIHFGLENRKISSDEFTVHSLRSPWNPVYS